MILIIIVIIIIDCTLVPAVLKDNSQSNGNGKFRPLWALPIQSSRRFMLTEQFCSYFQFRPRLSAEKFLSC